MQAAVIVVNVLLLMLFSWNKQNQARKHNASLAFWNVSLYSNYNRIVAECQLLYGKKISPLEIRNYN